VSHSKGQFSTSALLPKEFAMHLSVQENSGLKLSSAEKFALAFPSACFVERCNKYLVA